MRTISLSSATAGLALLLAVAPTRALAQCVVTEDGSDDQCFTLFVGQTIDAGTVCATVNGDDLDVTYTTTGGWELTEIHLWVGNNIADLPQTRKGNPIPGQFPFASGDITGTTSYTVSIPLSELGFSCPDYQEYLVAAHAAVRKALDDGTVQTETGWSDGTGITDKGNWATISTITLSCECGGTEPPSGQCETAFAYAPAPGGTCFLGIDEDGDGEGDFNRWGWTIGPLAQGYYTFDLYAGAGQCVLAKGTLVGSVDVGYFAGEATVTYTTTDPYWMDEAQIYVGNEILPRNNGYYTVAPGQYPHVSEDLNGAIFYESTFTGLSGSVYVVAHSTVCGF